MQYVDRNEESVSSSDGEADNKLVEDDIETSRDFNEQPDLEMLSKEELDKVIASSWTGQQGSPENKEPHERQGEDNKVGTGLEEVQELASERAGREENLEKLSKEELGKVIASRWTGEYTGAQGTKEEEHRDRDETQDVGIHDYEHDDEDDEYDPTDEDIMEDNDEPEKYIHENSMSQDDGGTQFVKHDI